MRYGLRQTFAVPLLLLLLTTIGLIVGLVGDGWPDLAAATALAIPLAVLARAWWRS